MFAHRSAALHPIFRSLRSNNKVYNIQHKSRDLPLKCLTIKDFNQHISIKITSLRNKVNGFSSDRQQTTIVAFSRDSQQFSLFV